MKNLTRKLPPLEDVSCAIGLPMILIDGLTLPRHASARTTSYARNKSCVEENMLTGERLAPEAPYFEKFHGIPALPYQGQTLPTLPPNSLRALNVFSDTVELFPDEASDVSDEFVPLEGVHPQDPT